MQTVAQDAEVVSEVWPVKKRSHRLLMMVGLSVFVLAGVVVLDWLTLWLSFTLLGWLGLPAAIGIPAGAWAWSIALVALLPNALVAGITASPQARLFWRTGSLDDQPGRPSRWRRLLMALPDVVATFGAGMLLLSRHIPDRAELAKLMLAATFLAVVVPKLAYWLAPQALRPLRSSRRKARLRAGATLDDDDVADRQDCPTGHHLPRCEHDEADAGS